MTRDGGGVFHVVLITYEFTFSSFSGNGMLSRSLVKSLLGHGCRISVWCCRPSSSTGDGHLEPPEITQEQFDRLEVFSINLSQDKEWYRLDADSAWTDFDWISLNKDESKRLAKSISNASVVCAIDWSGCHALRSIPKELKQVPMVYLNFRVYSSGVSNESMRGWYNDMERQALENAQSTIALSEKDKKVLSDLVPNDRGETLPIQILLPSLRADLEELAIVSPGEYEADLPPQVAAAITNHHEKRFLIACIVRLSPEKDTLRFFHLIKHLAPLLKKQGMIPFLAGAPSDAQYANEIKTKLRDVSPEAIIVESFLSPKSLAAVFSKTVVNFHPCSYDAYGMTIVEAAAFGVPSIVNEGGVIGATATVSSCFEISMPKQQQDLPQSSIEKVHAILKDRESIQQVGDKARKRALAWDEAAYGSKLLEHLKSL